MLLFSLYRSRKQRSRDSALYTMCLVFRAILRLDCDTFDDCGRKFWGLAIFAECYGLAPTYRGIDATPPSPREGCQQHQAGKAPDLAWGSPFEQAMLLYLESSPGMPRDTLARVARDSGEVSSRMARPKYHTSHTTDAHKIVSESARWFGEAPQPN